MKKCHLAGTGNSLGIRLCTRGKAQKTGTPKTGVGSKEQVTGEGRVSSGSCGPRVRFGTFSSDLGEET